MGQEVQKQTSLKELESICESGAVKFTDIATCIDSGLPSLAKTRKELGNEKLMGLIIITLNNTIGFFNNEISEHILISIAGKIAKKYHHLNLADMLLFSEKATSGEYGMPYGSLSGSLVMDWIAQYAGERDEFAEERSYQKHISLTSHEKERQYDGVIDRLQREGEKINKSKPISHQQFFKEKSTFNKEKLKWEVKS